MTPALFAWVFCAALQVAQETPPPEFDAAMIARIQRHTNPRPLEDPTNKVANSPAAARLGQALFFDTRVSQNGKLSCASCHDPAHAFADKKSLSQGLGTTTRHAPALVNAAAARWLFWDGRADSLWSQALQPLESENELGGSRRALTELVTRDDALRAAWIAAFGAPPDAHDVDRNFADLGKAIAAFEVRIARVSSPFDRFAAALQSGDRAEQARYPPDAQRGLLLFEGRAGCRTCHAGPWFSDGEFHNIGIPPLEGGIARDAGRLRGVEKVRADPFNAAGIFSDDPRGDRARELRDLTSGSELWGQFKTPSLRNVAIRAPYMHAGQMPTLDAILSYYSTLDGAVPAGHHGEQVLKPLHLTGREILDLRAFLETLTGDPAPPELSKPPW